MKKVFGHLAAILMLCGACGGSESPGGDGGGGSGGSASAQPEARGARYCEILLGYLEGTNVRIEVYNTYGLNDCPADAWNSLDPAQIKQEHQADSVILNGPRRWIIDRFVNSAFLDPTKVVLGGIEMRKAGELVLPLADAMSSPYATRTVERTTTWVFDAGKKVYELLDPAGRIFVMQSFSLEKGDRSETDLQGLGGQLGLPSMWTYRTRELTAELQVTAVDGVATITQDDQGNTYQLSQQ
jgi:hypothetical protein